MRSVCVYLGSRDGASPAWGEVAERVGRKIAERGWRLVYGGGRVGLMGRCADGAIAAGGEVIGVIPNALVEREAAHLGLTELIKVPDMHTRKARMSELSDGFIALPGGIGTFEELFEMWTWLYLGIHAKPVGLLNVDGFYDKLLSFLDDTVSAGFLATSTRQGLADDDDIDRLLDRMFTSAQ
ncbi:TIGR00730 family Rossman fold protein [Halotalea alkalilenta]|uniref:Cytokinin riboside 5'-monophosphate phosphoribohydrolase n=1 Tax=Halotalea alkalilenta TaxID=376489 RepID=A0A172YCE6_9GAMM|nr:TIGR00730 family Rossman fold protein [Halotalea alkalilenta]ANF56921.1 TIGR00730 family Rossman fold protein [Halotalea alkalilenta]